MPKVSEIEQKGASLESNETVASAVMKMAEGGFGCPLVTRKRSVNDIVRA